MKKVALLLLSCLAFLSCGVDFSSDSRLSGQASKKKISTSSANFCVANLWRAEYTLNYSYKIKCGPSSETVRFVTKNIWKKEKVLSYLYPQLEKKFSEMGFKIIKNRDFQLVIAERQSSKTINNDLIGHANYDLRYEGPFKGTKLPVLIQYSGELGSITFDDERQFSAYLAKNGWIEAGKVGALRIVKKSN